VFTDTTAGIDYTETIGTLMNTKEPSPCARRQNMKKMRLWVLAKWGEFANE